MLPCMRKKSAYISTAYRPRGSTKTPSDGANSASSEPVTDFKLAACVICCWIRRASLSSSFSSSPSRPEPGGTYNRNSTSWCSAAPSLRSSLNWMLTSLGTAPALVLVGTTHCETRDKSKSNNLLVEGSFPSASGSVCSTTNLFPWASKKCLPRFAPLEQNSRSSNLTPIDWRSFLRGSLFFAVKPSSLINTPSSPSSNTTLAYLPKTVHVARFTPFTCVTFPSDRPDRHV
mmetsp:Transcript_11901/g.31247  ORF Transcript_11901/g.31247 Transcript_11901/m.31247 type:complete len:231 (-) Transcript_11901:275-967(-)